MEQITAFFDKLKTKTATVAINISSRSVLEVAEFDRSGMIINYATVPIQYNAFTKEIENINDFESAIKRTFSELNLSLSSRIYASIPTFIIETEILPPIENDEEIKTALVTSAEKNYIFKKYDPAISYYKSPNNENSDMMNVTYTALRQDEFFKISNVFDALGMKVVAIDSSYSTLINGVIATQKVNPNIIENNENWNIINITSNSFMIFAMQGKNLTGVYEEPLAVKSFTEEEIYQVIVNSLELTIDKYPANQIVFVSQSDNVSAEYLSSIFEIDVVKSYIEDNKYRKQLVELGYNIIQSNKTKISLETVGLVNWPTNEDGFKFNFADVPVAVAAAASASAIPEIDSLQMPWIDGRQIDVSPQDIQKFALIYMLIFLVAILIAVGVVYSTKNAFVQEQTALAEEIQALESKVETKPKTFGANESDFLQRNYNNNVNLKKSYAAIAREIPNMLWIEEVHLNDSSKLYMKGRSYKMDDILNYYDSLNKLGKFQNLKISVLGISNNELSALLKSDVAEETTYEFAFGQAFLDDMSSDAAADGEGTPGVATDGAAPPPPPSDSPLPPAPPSIPKEDM